MSFPNFILDPSIPNNAEVITAKIEKLLGKPTTQCMISVKPHCFEWKWTEYLPISNLTPPSKRLGHRRL
jgi:hypothetical protein